MGQNQSEERIINYLNKHQTTYFVQSELHRKSNTRHFISFKRNDDDTVNLEDEKNCYILKILPYDNEEKITKFQKDQEILNLFKDNPQILNNEETIELTIEFKKYIIVPTKYYHQGDVYYYIWHRDIITVGLVRSVAFQAIQILGLLKEHHVVHNDIKFQNFLVESVKPLQIALHDFNYAQILNDDEKSNQCGGTPVFEAPEILEKKEHDYSSDIWSLGANIYLALCSELPFGLTDDDDDESKILDKIKNNQLENKNDKVPPDAWECITKMLTFNPDDRITPKDALDLNWFLPEINKSYGI